MTIRFRIEGFTGIFDVDTYAVTGADRQAATALRDQLQRHTDRQILLADGYYPSKDYFAEETLRTFLATVLEKTVAADLTGDVVY